MTRTWLAAAIALMAPGSAAADSERLVIRGEVTCCAEIAVPPESLALELRDLAAPVGVPPLAQQRIALGGRPILAGGPQPVATSAPVGDVGPIVMEQSTGQLRATALRCGDLAIQAAFTGDRARLEIDGERLELEQRRSASGALYSDGADPPTSFWSKGRRAMLVLRGVEQPECLVQEPPTTLRATGNEPGWSLVVDEAGLELTTRYGERRLRASGVTIDSSAGRSIYRAEADGQTVTVTVTDRLCTDTMSGMQRPLTVEVEMTGERLLGCGGEAKSLLLGEEWAVVSLDGRAVAPGSAPSLGFDAEGNVFGKGSCNRYRGPYQLTGESLTMGPLASTMMACTPALMDQEERFLALLAEVRGFAIGPDGALTLSTGDGRAILARRG